MIDELQMLAHRNGKNDLSLLYITATALILVFFAVPVVVSHRVLAFLGMVAWAANSRQDMVAGTLAHCGAIGALGSAIILRGAARVAIVAISVIALLISWCLFVMQWVALITIITSLPFLLSCIFLLCILLRHGHSLYRGRQLLFSMKDLIIAISLYGTALGVAHARGVLDSFDPIEYRINLREDGTHVPAALIIRSGRYKPVMLRNLVADILAHNAETEIQIDGPGHADEMVHVLKDLEIERLSLQDTSISDSGLRDIAELTTLKSLSVGRTSVTDDGILRLAGLVHMESLALYECKLSNRSLEALGQMNRLANLDLSDTNIDAKGTCVLASLTALRELTLDNTKIDADGLQCLDSLKHLEWLSLRGVTLDDSALGAIASLPSLKYLVVHRNRVKNLQSLEQYIKEHPTVNVSY